MEAEKTMNKEGSVWLGEDGIIKIKTGKISDLITAKRIAVQVYDIAKTLKKKPRIIIDVRLSDPTLDILWRKGMADIFLDSYRKTGMEKIALWGAKMKVIEIVGSFIIGASGLKNIKMFETEKEALEWVKK